MQKSQSYTNPKPWLITDLILMVLLALVPWMAYQHMPLIVPTHWNAGGQVTSYGSSFSTALLLSTVMPLANAIILVVYAFRWKLVKEYPYLINLPAIAMLIGSEKIPVEKKHELIEKMFTVTLIIGCFVGAYLLIIEAGILYSMITFTTSNWVIIVSIVGIPLMILPPFYMYRKIYNEEMLKYVKRV